MLILFDNGTPAPLRYALKGHVVVEAVERGWDRLVNGEFIAAAEEAGFDLLLTTDKNMRNQQNLAGRKIAFVVLGNQQWPVLRLYVEGLWPQAMQPHGQLHGSRNSVRVTQRWVICYPVHRPRELAELAGTIKLRVPVEGQEVVPGSERLMGGL